ncbi:histidine kinase [Methylobacterium sp. C25]|uniref:histidine kinase n=1 Tax=Methylobacterium sp. C25 TaxID=2721622 RepID=UPI001F2F0AC9|nr:histidine kinase [Methylobacterium sp. C25]MCE4226746.1 histidine kinase [Methylobacterium sp. C25]
MADYYPLLSRALDALPDRTPALRKAVYDRARSALIGQLRTLEPPLPDEAIEVERKALDAAIERLESENGAPAAPPPPPPAAPPPTPPEVKAEPKSEPEPEPVPTAAPLPPAAAVPEAAPFIPPSPPPPPQEPEAPAEEPLPEAGPPPAFTPFVPPPRRPRLDEDPGVPVQDTAPAPPSVQDVAPPEGGNGRRRPKLDVKAPRTGQSRRLRNLVVGGVLAVVIGLIAVAAIMLADKRSDLPQDSADTEASAPAQPDAKLSDRVGGEKPEGDQQSAVQESGSNATPTSPSSPTSPAPAPSRPDVAVAQRAVLYEENSADPKAQPTAIQGRVLWRLDAVNGEQGQPLQSAVRANIEFPEAGLTLAMTIRKNLDATLPASHTIELAFTNYGPGEKRAVQEIGLLQLKDEEGGRGSPVSGLPVRVRDNLFLIGLSNLPSDIDRNTEMLTHRNWIDLAVKYKDGPRAILSFERGTAGARVLQDAFSQWR